MAYYYSVIVMNSSGDYLDGATVHFYSKETYFDQTVDTSSGIAWVDASYGDPSYVLVDVTCDGYEDEEGYMVPKTTEEWDYTEIYLSEHIPVVTSITVKVGGTSGSTSVTVGGQKEIVVTANYDDGSTETVTNSATLTRNNTNIEIV